MKFTVRAGTVLLLALIICFTAACGAEISTKLTVDDKLSLTVASVTDSGERVVDFECDGVFEEALARVGTMPLPPYIHEKLKDQNRYQTVYARTDGSAAAPTA